jgi:hypothetical protein
MDFSVLDPNPPSTHTEPREETRKAEPAPIYAEGFKVINAARKIIQHLVPRRTQLERAIGYQ